MAFRLGITGLPNTGKSFAWKFYKQADDVFAICPSTKIIHARKKDGSLLQPLSIQWKGVGKNLQEIQTKKPAVKSLAHLLTLIVKKQKPASEFIISGDYIVCSEVQYVKGIKQFVDKYMSNKKIILNPDFTHYISYIMQDPVFINRKSGGEAFQRFWEMAADVLRNTILSADSLTNVQLDITEFHSEYNEALDMFEIYTPGGKMLTEKFKPSSYFDLMLFSKVLPYTDTVKEEDRFKFVVVKKEGLDGRSMGIFSNTAVKGEIPNNMETVVNGVRKYLGYK